MRAYALDGDSRSAHRTSAESMMTVNGPSGAVDKQALRDVDNTVWAARPTLLDRVQNGFGKIGRCLAVAGDLCSPVDKMQSFSGRIPCKC
jgi:hypothetical protein